MNQLKSISSTVLKEYKQQLTRKKQLTDGFIVYTVVVGLIQLVYMALVGGFPFNSFLSGFLCQLGLFALAVSLRLQLSFPSEFRNVSSERALGDFILGSLILFFVVFSFMG